MQQPEPHIGDVSEPPGAPEAAVPAVSVLIPVFNGAHTIEQALAGVYSSRFTDFEIVVVNDGSTDNSLEVLNGLSRKYPHRLIDLGENMGVSKARNAAAAAARGEIILFIDADCIVQPDTIGACVNELHKGDSICVGGAYTREPWDDHFFSAFQSLYIHYVETKTEYPDYVATHCMAIRRQTFEDFGGFITESFIGHDASVEDVEFSHRLIEAGYQLSRPKTIMVQHIFNYDMNKSVKNAIKKSKYWTMYSLKHSDITKDSGAASYELKTNVSTQTLNLGLLATFGLTRKRWLLIPMAILFAINLTVCGPLLLLFRRERGWWFLFRAASYYLFVYPYVVAYGSGLGTLKYIWEVKLLRRYD